MSVPTKNATLKIAMQAREAAEELTGTANDFDEVVGFSYNDMPAEWRAEFDELVFLCEVCGWWCDADEMANAEKCTECEADV